MKPKTIRKRSMQDKTILFVCFCLLSILTTGIIISIASPENSTNSVNSNTGSVQSSTTIQLKPGHQYILLDKDDPYNLESYEYNSVVHNTSPVDELQKFDMYLDVGTFNPHFIATNMRFKTFTENVQKFQENLWATVDAGELNEKKGLLTSIFYDIDVEREFLYKIEEIKELTSDFKLSGEPLENLNVLLRIDVYNIFLQYYFSYPDSFDEKHDPARGRLVNYINAYKQWERIQYVFTRIPFIVLECGNKKYRKSMVLGKDKEAVELDLLKYKITEYSIYTLFRMFNINSEGKIVEWHLLTEEQIKEVMVGDNKSFIESEKKIIKEKTEAILSMLFDGRETFDMTEIYELYHEVTTSMLNIKEKIDTKVK
eukprot:GAHX01000106.1.p1 GENE.GAHX01000106.1~~GAHX01000106.1.p1  ORF type:complete len:370 (-),score=69.95 GAHX01000106.1:56-1165(-)